MKYLIPFQGENASASAKDNLLVEDNNIYIMDNHRLSLWCWFQKIEKNEKYNLFHIDAHPDMSESANKTFKHKNLDMWTMSLEEYRTVLQEEINTPLFRWDNYIKILFHFYPRVVDINNTFSATFKVGSTEALANDFTPYRLASELHSIFNGKKFINENKWIVNLDLDYFFTSLPDKTLMFSQEYIESIATSLKIGLENNLIQVLTIALSPECCGGWKKAQKTLSLFNKILNISEFINDEI